MSDEPQHTLPTTEGLANFASITLGTLIEALVTSGVLRQDVIADGLARQYLLQRRLEADYPGHPVAQATLIESLEELLRSVLAMPDARPSEHAPLPDQNGLERLRKLLTENPYRPAVR